MFFILCLVDSFSKESHYFCTPKTFVESLVLATIVLLCLEYSNSKLVSHALLKLSLFRGIRESERGREKEKERERERKRERQRERERKREKEKKKKEKEREKSETLFF